MAVDASYLYWATQNDVYWATHNDVANGGGTITRANLDGSGQRFLAIGSDNPTGVAVDANHVYWTTGGSGPSSGTINRAGLEGSVPQAIVPGQDFPYGVAVDPSFLYWVNRSDNTVHLANLDGSNPQTLGGGQGAWGLAVSPVVSVV